MGPAPSSQSERLTTQGCETVAMSEAEASAGSLERSATSNLWRNTLSRISSLYGRLAYLSSLRNPNSGQYEHHGLALVFGQDEARKALRRAHRQVFAEWLSCSLKQQKEDLDLYISGLSDDTQTVVENWATVGPNRKLVPATAKSAERQLYMSDMKVLIELFKNGCPQSRGPTGLADPRD